MIFQTTLLDYHTVNLILMKQMLGGISLKKTSIIYTNGMITIILLALLQKEPYLEKKYWEREEEF